MSMAVTKSKRVFDISPVKVNRMTVIEQVYHQQGLEQPVQITTQFVRNLKSDEEPYSARKVAIPTPEVIDYGWIVKPAYVVLRNDDSVKLLEVFVSGPESSPLLVYPKDSLRIVPTAKPMVSGDGKYTIFIIPE